MKKSLLLSLIPMFLLASCGEKTQVKYAVSYSTGNNYTFAGPAEVNQGEEFDFTLTYAAGYVGEFTVTGASYKETDTGYHAYNVISNVSVEMTKIEKIKFDVTKPVEEHFKINGDNKVEYGDNYSFTVEYDAGYKGIVKVNDEVIEPVDNVYVVSDVKEDLIISVETSLKKILIVKPDDEGKKFTFNGENMIDYGKDYSFVVEFDEGYTGVVKANDVILKAAEDEKTYTVSSVKIMTTITVDVNFTVAAPSVSEDYTFTGAEVGTIGEDYSFSLIFAKYKQGSVTINGNPAVGVDGIYTVESVQENLVIEVSDVVTNLIVLDKNNTLSAYNTVTGNTTERVLYNKNIVVRGNLNDSLLGEIGFEVYNFQSSADNFGAWRGNNIDRFIRNIDPVNGLGSIKVSQDNLTLDLGTKVGDEIIYIENGIALTKDVAYNITSDYCYFRLNYTGGWAALNKVEIYYRNDIVEQEFTKSIWLNRHSIGTDPSKGEITNMCQKTCDNSGNPISDGAKLSMNDIDSLHAWSDGTINGQYINTQRRLDETYTWDMPYRNFSSKNAATIRFKTSGADFELTLDSNKVFKSYSKDTKDKTSEYTVTVYEGKLYCDGNFIYSLTEDQNNGMEVMRVSLYVKDSYKTGLNNQYAWFGMSSYYAYALSE